MSKSKVVETQGGLPSEFTRTDPRAVDAPLATHRRQVTVQWSHLDAAGRVTLSQYVRWMEETEYSFLRERGLSVSMTDERGQFGFPRLNTVVNVQGWPSLGSELAIELTLNRLTAKQIEYSFRVTDVASAQLPAARTKSDSLPASAEPVDGEAWANVGPSGSLVATGRFIAACCRFPAQAMPYAILIPDDVLDKIAPSTHAGSSVDD